MKLPNDMELEMEELEGLVNVELTSSSSLPSPSKKSKSKQGIEMEINSSFLDCGSLNKKDRKRRFITTLLLLVGIVGFFLAGKANEQTKQQQQQQSKKKKKKNPPNIASITSSSSRGSGSGGSSSNDKNENVSLEKTNSQASESDGIQKKSPKSKNEPNSKNDHKDSKKGDDDDNEEGGGDDDDDKKKAKLIEEYGEWHFWDGAEETRPTNDYCAAYPNRDISEMDFPSNSWQVDAVYVNHFLDDASKLVARAKEAIYAEYGHAKKDLDAGGMMERAKMFRLQMIDFASYSGNKAPPLALTTGGWTTTRSFDGLVRRLLHAMMTNDTFTVVMGGHSSAAGHGNHFMQSYMMQFHHIMEPIFNRLGVKLITRNIGQGGLGTIQAALGSASIYGDDIDMLIWDSLMTERRPSDFDLFARQALLGGKRAPVLWGGLFSILKDLHESAGADVGHYGNAMDGIPLTLDETQLETLPWAVQRLKCDKQREDLCDQPEYRYRTQCWVERSDVTPPQKQDSYVGSRTKWHPGWRVHQLTSRVLAFTILDALQSAINTWSEVTITAGHPLPDSYWHITEHYNSIREKTKNLPSNIGKCHELKQFLPERVCTIPLISKTEFTPRANPQNNSIVSILKPSPGNGYVPKMEETMLYEGPDVPNPVFDLPKDAVDVRAIVSNRRRVRRRHRRHRRRKLTQSMNHNNGRRRTVAAMETVDTKNEAMETASMETVLSTTSQLQHILNQTTFFSSSSSSSSLFRRRRMENHTNSIVPGIGWEIGDEPPGYCDGTASSQCGRSPSSTCLLSGHQDHRGGLIGNEYSGWIVMTLDRPVEHGIIIVKIEDWLKSERSKRTEGWTEVNNGNRNDHQRRRLTEDDIMMESDGMMEFVEDEGKIMSSEVTRRLLPDSFIFEFAIDKQVTTWTKTEFEEQLKEIQRASKFVTLLDDPKKFDNKTNVEVALRLRGCGRDCTFKLTHIYWA